MVARWRWDGEVEQRRSGICGNHYQTDEDDPARESGLVPRDELGTLSAKPECCNGHDSLQIYDAITMSPAMNSCWAALLFRIVRL
jgi:hypothetical protein